MALLLKGGEFIATEALSVSVLKGLMGFARIQAVRLNGIEFSTDDLAGLVEEAEQAGRPIWPCPAINKATRLP